MWLVLALLFVAPAFSVGPSGPFYADNLRPRLQSVKSRVFDGLNFFRDAAAAAEFELGMVMAGACNNGAPCPTMCGIYTPPASLLETDTDLEVEDSASEEAEIETENENETDNEQESSQSQNIVVLTDPQSVLVRRLSRAGCSLLYPCDYRCLQQNVTAYVEAYDLENAVNAYRGMTAATQVMNNTLSYAIDNLAVNIDTFGTNISMSVFFGAARVVQYNTTASVAYTAPLIFDLLWREMQEYLSNLHPFLHGYLF
eukprot:TRINITY_DN2009_c0_g1_i1.p1 TRINITY_DN2009_c0_g1~~TRINITY_DN2009_c0_g1_i1.p1  ORF type:complete len:256 (+),score=54.27 TRINITY_DN2009_c0_g1_i1:89-856(+)